jgi:XTP/dITP diphosphohydrolase
MLGFMDVVLASGNLKKAAELRALLEPLELHVLSPDDVGGLPEVDEDQPTFTGNARKKAESGARASGRWCLADDSGLCVDALDGAPGVRSARFAGTHGDDQANNRRLLDELANVPSERRKARFVCAVALASPDGTTEAVFEGEVQGRILESPRGAGGFGYDPLFLFTEPGHPQTGRGFAELSQAEKATVSHRGRALQRLTKHFARWTAT